MSLAGAYPGQALPLGAGRDRTRSRRRLPARAADEITLREAAEAVEGLFGVFHCIMENRACGERASCVLHDAWEEGLSAILEYLGAQTLDEFVAGTASGKLFSQTLPEDRPTSTG